MTTPAPSLSTNPVRLRGRAKITPEVKAKSREIILNIFATCKLMGIKQSELARQANVTRTAVNRWAMGDNSPSLENLIKISEALEMPLHTLLAPNSATETAKRLREFDEQYAQARAELLKGYPVSSHE